MSGDALSAMIELEGLTKRYGEFTAVQSLDLRVAKGELFALLGPNGAGKTTTLRVLMGFLKASAGRARIAGLDCFERRVELMRIVGYLPDDPVFYDYLRGREIIEFAGEMHGLGVKEIHERSAPLIETLELGDALEDFATNYSRGMKKKLAWVLADSASKSATGARTRSNTLSRYSFAAAELSANLGKSTSLSTSPRCPGP